MSLFSIMNLMTKPKNAQIENSPDWYRLKNYCQNIGRGKLPNKDRDVGHWTSNKNYSLILVQTETAMVQR